MGDSVVEPSTAPLTDVWTKARHIVSVKSIDLWRCGWMNYFNVADRHYFVAHCTQRRVVWFISSLDEAQRADQGRVERSNENAVDGRPKGYRRFRNECHTQSSGDGVLDIVNMIEFHRRSHFYPCCTQPSTC